MLRNKARRGLARVRIGAGRVAGEHRGALRRWLVSRPRPPRRVGPTPQWVQAGRRCGGRRV